VVSSVATSHTGYHRRRFSPWST